MTWPRRRRPSGPSRSMNLPIAVQAALDDAAPGSSWIWAEDGKGGGRNASLARISHTDE